MIVPSQRKTVHGLPDPPLCVDDPCVVGDEQIEEFLALLISIQTVNGKTFAAMVLEVGST
jgi:hypothetical protein